MKAVKHRNDVLMYDEMASLSSRCLNDLSGQLITPPNLSKSYLFYSESFSNYYTARKDLVVSKSYLISADKTQATCALVTPF